MITRERVDLAVEAAKMQAQMDSVRKATATSAVPARAFRFPTTWPTCEKAPRTTKPRLK